MDAHEMIAGHAELSACVLGNAAGQYMLVPLDGEGYPLSETEVHEARLRGFEYVGLLGFKGGAFGYRAEPGPLCALAMFRACLEFAAYVASRLQQPKKTDDSVAWLERLMSLEDPRDAN